MSSNKRKRSGEDGQARDDKHPKQKKHKSHGRTATADLDGKSSATKPQEQSSNNDSVTESDIINLAPEVRAAQGRRHGQKKSRKRDSDPALEDNKASTSAQAKVKVDSGITFPDGQVAKVVPGEREVQSDNSRQRGKRKSRKKDADAALDVNEPSMSIQAEVETADGVSIPDGEVANVTSEGKKAKRQRKREKRRRAKEEAAAKRDQAPTWGLSESTGGCMLRIDPLFSHSEDCMLIAYDLSVCVFSISTSLLLRRLRGKTSKQISSLAFCPVDTAQLYISKVTGKVEKWDWTNGTLLGIWDTKIPVHLIATLSPNSTGQGTDYVYSVDKLKGSRWTITAHRLMAGENASKTDLNTLLKYEEPITSIRIFEESSIIVATSGHKLLIGYTDNPHQPLLKDISYVWREITCSEWIASIDTRIRSVERSSKKPKSVKAVAKCAVDIVVGGNKGAIFVYEDLLASLISKEDKSKAGITENITPRKLHWHRNAVSSVKWSTDGLQDLPHLSAAIESVVVSPSGTSYGIRLADNSAMILSTTELQPTFSVAGIQLPAAERTNGIELPSIPTVDFPKGDLLPKQDLRFPAVSGTSAGQLLLAVPANSVSGTSTRHACFLQTFDVNSAQQVSRQALTRNKVTILNMGPEGNTIEEPNVTHMQLSHDGTWLATVDEWIPPKRDLDHISFDDQRAKEEQSLRNEVYLKFWTWDDSTSSWELVSRIDHPQQSSSNSTGRVLDLVADPLHTGFASVGEGGVIKMWKPQLRKRHGLNVRNKEGKPLTSWDCRWTNHLPSTGPVAASTSRIIKLAFSPDASVLAAGMSTTSAVHQISTSSGMLHSTLDAQFEGPLFGLGIIDRYMITLSSELRVWDLVTEELHYGFAFDASQGSLERRLVYTHLATDHKHNTFAIAVPELDLASKGRGSGSTSRIAIFDVEHAEPVYNHTQQKLTRSLLPVVGKKGFYCIDTAAEIRTLSAAPKLPEVLGQASTAQKEPPALGLSNIYGTGPANIDGSRREVLKLTSTNVVAQRVEEDDTKVVSADKLAEVFAAGSALGLPSVTEMFEQVAVLFAGI
ncbi:MAG: hypothetical protein Q9195_007411 [Heterodermia aff. obscurata]